MICTLIRPVAAALAVGSLCAPLAAQLGTVTLSNEKTAFLEQTGALGQGPLPALGVTTDPVAVGELVIAHAAPAIDLILTDWTPLLPGTDLGLSGHELLDITSATPMHAFGFDAVEPSTPGPDGCNFPTCVDSTFALRLFAGVELVGETSFNLFDDAAVFIGVTCDRAFDRVELRELTDDVGNEYFGEFFVGRCQPSVNYGAGTAGTGGFTPLLPPPTQLVAAGQTGVALEASGILGGTPTLLLIGLEPQDVLVKGIDLLVLPGIFLPIAVSGPPGVAGVGAFSLPLQLSSASALVGTTVYCQVLTIDDNGSPFGYASSAGLALTICPPQ